MRCRDDAHVHPYGLDAAYPLEFALLDGAQHLVCVFMSMSPISSRNSVPLSAHSNLPRFDATAPVNDPFSWPNNSLSMRFSGIAAQFTLTKGPAARWLCEWMAYAMSSLPVPLSPEMSTRPFGRRHLLHFVQNSLNRRAPAHYLVFVIVPLAELPDLVALLFGKDGVPDDLLHLNHDRAFAENGRRPILPPEPRIRWCRVRRS